MKFWSPQTRISTEMAQTIQCIIRLKLYYQFNDGDDFIWIIVWNTCYDAVLCLRSWWYLSLRLLFLYYNIMNCPDFIFIIILFTIELIIQRRPWIHLKNLYGTRVAMQILPFVRSLKTQRPFIAIEANKKWNRGFAAECTHELYHFFIIEFVAAFIVFISKLWQCHYFMYNIMVHLFLMSYYIIIYLLYNYYIVHTLKSTVLLLWLFLLFLVRCCFRLCSLECSVFMHVYLDWTDLWTFRNGWNNFWNCVSFEKFVF